VNDEERTRGKEKMYVRTRKYRVPTVKLYSMEEQVVIYPN
jgi:hypothetical protein